MILRLSESLVPVWSLQRHVCANVKSNNRKVIVCGLRSSYRKRPPSRVLSKEAIQVIHALKLAKPDDLPQVLNTRLTRLLKPDVLDLLAELKRQNQLHLSLKVFNFVREEPGYDSLLPMYSDMIQLLGRNKMTEEAEELFSQVVENGLKPDARLCNEMIGAYLRVGMTEKAMQVYESMKMKASGCSPDKLTFTILIRNFEKAGEDGLAATLKQECVDYVDSPDKFIREVEQKTCKKERFRSRVKIDATLLLYSVSFSDGVLLGALTCSFSSNSSVFVGGKGPIEGNDHR